jgi:hypothetical protein
VGSPVPQPKAQFWTFSAVVLALTGLTAGHATAQDCPTARSGKLGFALERGDQQKSEVFHGNDGVVRIVMRYNGVVTLETTLYQGLFELGRLDRGRETKFEPQTDLKRLFPLEPGQRVNAKFASESDGRPGQLSVSMTVLGMEEVYIGSCRYFVWEIERNESLGDDAPRFVGIDSYSPELKLVLSKAYYGDKHRAIRYDRIYPLQR